MTDQEKIITAVSRIYDWIDNQINKYYFQCRACGNCCNFGSYGHRLFITSPEIVYFKYHIRNDLKKMNDDICPYMTDNTCSIHKHRFSGCRIFFCIHSQETQNLLSEESIDRFREICINFHLPYKYTDLKTALNSL